MPPDRRFTPLTEEQLNEAAQVTTEDRSLAQTSWRSALTTHPLRDLLDARPTPNLQVER